jgi:peptide/nickel transport system permease protein
MVLPNVELPAIGHPPAGVVRLRSRMVKLVARRLGWSIPVLLLASILMFVFVRATTDPLAQIRQQVSGGEGGADAGRALVQEQHELGLDRPLASQYATWLDRFVRGDWGESIVSRGSVGAAIRSGLWNTTQLAVWAILFALVMAVVVGVMSAARQYSALDHTLTGLSFVGLSMPSFWFALMAIEWLVYMPKHLFHLQHPLLYSVGLHSATGGGAVDYLRHLVLPVLTLSLPLAAVWSRYLRSSMLDVLSAPFVRTARAKGVSRTTVLMRHALRNALIPFTTVSALAIGSLFGGVIITETIFAWPGMGELFYNALLAGDTNVLLPWLMVAASFVLALNLVADLLYGVLDPRVRL